MPPPICILLAFVAWTLWVFAMGMRRGRRLTQEDLAESRSIPVTQAEAETSLFTDRKEISLHATCGQH